MALRASTILISVALSALSTDSDAGGTLLQGGFGTLPHRDTGSTGFQQHRQQWQGIRGRQDLRRRRDTNSNIFDRRHHRNGNLNLYLAPPLHASPSYGNSYLYEPPAYYVVPRPSAYVQRPQQERQQHYWYWCPDRGGYYPYVKNCPRPWQPVKPYGTPPH